MQSMFSQRKINIPTQSTIPSFSQKAINQNLYKKPPFGRKRQIDDVSADKKGQAMLSRKSKEAHNSSKQASIDRVRSGNQKNMADGESKYVSPHFTRTNKMLSPSQKCEVESQHRFVRRPTLNSETSREKNISNQSKEPRKRQTYEKGEVQISLQSVLTKGSDLSDPETLPSNWFALEAQNEMLKRQKKELQNEVSALRELLWKTNIPIPKFFNLPSVKHHNCHCKQNSLIGVQTERQLGAKVRQLQKKEEQLINKLRQDQIQIDMLNHELLHVTKQLEAETIAKFQLTKMVESLRLECSHQRRALEKQVVKQDMLMRQKAEYQDAKMLASKAGRERENFRKTILQYKQKINLLTSVIAKSRKEFKKEEELEYSLDLSTSMDSF